MKINKWICSCCKEQFETRAKLFEHKKNVHKFECPHCHLHFNSGHDVGTHVLHCELNPKFQEMKDKRIKTLKSNKGKQLSMEHCENISRSLKQYYLNNPDKVPYLINHSSKESYPEKYFRIAFTNNNFPAFVQDKYVNGYFLDFAFENSKQYIEIDGEQHYTDKKIIEHDKLRTKNLNKTEWKCIARIRWSDFQKLTSEQKHNFILQLKQRTV